RLDPSDGGLSPLQTVTASNPSYLALDPTLQHLYSVNELTNGRVSAYAINQGNGTLSFLNTQSANGKDTTHLSVQPSGTYLFAANYTSGNFPVFRILANGFIGPIPTSSRAWATGPDQIPPGRKIRTPTRSSPIWMATTCSASTSAPIR